MKARYLESAQLSISATGELLVDKAPKFRLFLEQY